MVPSKCTKYNVSLQGCKPFITKTNNLSQFCTVSRTFGPMSSLCFRLYPRRGQESWPRDSGDLQGPARQLEHCVQTKEDQDRLWLSERAHSPSQLSPRELNLSNRLAPPRSIGSLLGTAGPNQRCQLLPKLYLISAGAGAGRLSKSMSSRRPAMSTSPMIGRKKRSPSRLCGMDLREEAVRRTWARRPWPAGHQGSRTSNSA